jgi:hypothetical protein
MYRKKPSKAEVKLALSMFGGSDCEPPRAQRNGPARLPRALSAGEELEHYKVIQFIKRNWPHVVVRTDMAGVRLSPGLRAKMAALQSHRGYPDIFIASAHHGYFGAYLEMKTEPSKYLNKNGSYKASVHHQADCMEILNSAGYFATFAAPGDVGIEIAEWYLDGPETAIPLGRPSIPDRPQQCVCGQWFLFECVRCDQRGGIS